MIEPYNALEPHYRVSAVYGVLDKETAHTLDRLLTHLTALAHEIWAIHPVEEPGVAAQLREDYGYDIETAGPAEHAALYARVTEECVTLVRALGAARSAGTIRPLYASSALRLDVPTLPPLRTGYTPGHPD
jgi:hypothetical protein